VTKREQEMRDMPATALGSVPGGQALIDWFGRTPRFHDAELLEINLASKGPSVLRIHAWQITEGTLRAKQMHIGFVPGKP
jgi:hypothetical protein